MRDILVPVVAVRMPVVGFGCSALTGTSRKDALQLLGKAFDAGVRHFDVARSYGYGEAEAILGAFVKSRRAEVTITTKFGIQPPRLTSVLGMAVQMGRRFVRLLPSTRTFMQRRTQRLTRGGAFSVKDARISLETSLRELDTDSIDFYLLHDYVVDSHSIDDLVAFLRDAVRAGKVRSFGIGTGIGNVLRALEYQPVLCDVLQFENSVLTQNIRRLPPRTVSDRFVITHGSVRSYRSVSSFLKADSSMAKDWSEKLGADCSQEDTISSLLLNYAVEANPHGLVIFSSMKPTRVTKNVKAVLESSFSAEQVALFGQLVERELKPLVRSSKPLTHGGTSG
jgi:D-threo-aldose 1-dehydrogenase